VSDYVSPDDRPIVAIVYDDDGNEIDGCYTCS